MDTDQGGERRPCRLIGLGTMALGLFIVLISVNVIPVADSTFSAPRWVAGCAGLRFLLAGAAVALARPAAAPGTVAANPYLGGAAALVLVHVAAKGERVAGGDPVEAVRRRVLVHVDPHEPAQAEALGVATIGQQIVVAHGPHGHDENGMRAPRRERGPVLAEHVVREAGDDFRVAAQHREGDARATAQVRFRDRQRIHGALLDGTGLLVTQTVAGHRRYTRKGSMRPARPSRLSKR